MSKSAIRTINAALVIINKAGVSLPHLLNIQDPALRAAWRNADHLACFTVRCLADCFEAETLDDIKNHGWDSMTDACQRYYESGLDLWNGKQWKETGHINAAEELQRLADMVARWVKYHDDQVQAAMAQARASQSYEMVLRARHVAANNFGGTIGEQEELHDELNAKGHYAAALLVNRFDGSRFNNHKAERAAFRDFLTKVLGELVDLDHTVALHDDLKREVLAVASHELQTAHNNGDIDLRAVIRNNAPDLVRIACRNFERCYAEDVNPLGYVIDHDGMILKIESVEDCIDGEGFINAFIGKGNVHTKAIHYSRKALVNWFMPEAAPEISHVTAKSHADYAVRMAVSALTSRINPSNFEAMLEHAAVFAVPNYMRRVWTDYGDSAIRAIRWKPAHYESRQAALDSGDYDVYRSLAGGVLQNDIERGLVVIGQ